jgi:hypothetical protein
MKRARVIIVVLWLAASSVAQAPPERKAQPTRNPSVVQGSTNVKPKEPPSQSTGQTQIFVTYENPGADHKVSKEQSEDIDVQRQLARFTKYLVWVGVFQALILAGQGVLFFQQKQIMGQHKESLEQLAGAAKANATAAQKTATALMEGSRPWLMIEKTQTQDRIDDPNLLTPEQMMVRQQLPHCIFFLKNYGNTMAKMTAWKYELQIGDDANTPPDMSVYDMRSLPNFVPDIVSGMASVAQEARFRTAPGPQDFADITKGTKFLWLCGTVHYEDGFNQGDASKHETVFCYLWETRMSTPKSFWSLGGPAISNRTT